MISTPVRRTAGRMHWLASWMTPVVALLAYLALWPIGVNPVAWTAPKDVDYVGVHQSNQRLAGIQHVSLLPGQEGPEHIAAHQGAVYTGVANGDIVKIDGKQLLPMVVANTGGRPLGIDFDAQGRMLVADAFKGLLRISGEGAQAKIESMLTQIEEPVPNDPVRYADGVKVGSDGSVWLTDASRRFSAKELKSTFEASVFDVVEHSCTGRVIAVDPVSLKSRVALSGLCFPNGMALTPDGKAMFLAETGLYRILKIDLAKLSVTHSSQGAIGAPTAQQALEQGAAQVLVDNLPGYPDNLMRGENGRLWVGLTKPRSRLIDKLAGQPFIRSVVLRFPSAMWPVPKPYGHIIAYDDQGKMLENLQDPAGGYPQTTGATELDGKLFIQSLHANTVAWMPFPAASGASQP